MLDKKKISNFWKKRAEVKDPVVATHWKHDSAIQYDLELVKRFLNKSDIRLLDLGCGTGRTTNALEPFVQHITAVDKQREFLEHCKKSEKIKTICSEVETYFDDEKYNIIIIFGVMNYVNEKESGIIYRNCKKMLSKDGILIVKHACGVKSDVMVDHFSENINDYYHAEYRYVFKEQELLRSAGFNVTIEDIYPEELNPWENTHFYAFICKNFN